MEDFGIRTLALCESKVLFCVAKEELNLKAEAIIIEYRFWAYACVGAKIDLRRVDISRLRVDFLDDNHLRPSFEGINIHLCAKTFLGYALPPLRWKNR